MFAAFQPSAHDFEPKKKPNQRRKRRQFEAMSASTLGLYRRMLREAQGFLSYNVRCVYLVPVLRMRGWV